MEKNFLTMVRDTWTGPTAYIAIPGGLVVGTLTVALMYGAEAMPGGLIGGLIAHSVMIPFALWLKKKYPGDTHA